MPGRSRSKSFYVPRKRKEIDPIDRTIGSIDEEEEEKEVDEEESNKLGEETTESSDAGGDNEEGASWAVNRTDPAVVTMIAAYNVTDPMALAKEGEEGDGEGGFWTVSGAGTAVVAGEEATNEVNDNVFAGVTSYSTS